MDGLFGDGLVDVLCCGGDSLGKDLRWGPRLGALVDLVEFEDGVTNGGVALFKIVEALSGGAFFFSTSVELKTKGAGGGGGGAGREMMDSKSPRPHHPNFWKFIDILKREQSLNHVNISQARAGHQSEPQRRRYQDSNRRIKNIVQDYHNRDRLQYLRRLARNISMWRNGFLKTTKLPALCHPKRFF